MGQIVQSGEFKGIFSVLVDVDVSLISQVEEGGGNIAVVYIPSMIYPTSTGVSPSGG